MKIINSKSEKQKKFAKDMIKVGIENIKMYSIPDKYDSEHEANMKKLSILAVEKILSMDEIDVNAAIKFGRDIAPQPEHDINGNIIGYTSFSRAQFKIFFHDNRFSKDEYRKYV